MSNNIRTISQLTELELKSFSELNSENLFLEVSKKEGDTVKTYKLSMNKFLNLLFTRIHDDGDTRWVTLASDQDNISGKKTFINNVNFNNGTKIDENGVIHSDKIIEGTARRAYWA